MTDFRHSQNRFQSPKQNTPFHQRIDMYSAPVETIKIYTKRTEKKTHKPPPSATVSAANSILDHGVDHAHMPLGVCLTPLVVVVEAVGPKVAPAAVDDGALAVEAPEQRQRPGPVAAAAHVVEGVGGADAERVRDLVHGRARVHVGPVGAEAQVAVERRLGGGHARRVVHPDRLGRVGAVPVVARHRVAHRRLDPVVRVRLVGGWVGCLLERPVERGRRGAGAGQRRGEDGGELHVCFVGDQGLGKIYGICTGWQDWMWLPVGEPC